jgi:hypothetical protein
LNGFDRLVFRGTLRPIAFAAGLMSFLWRRQVLLKDFGAYAQLLTEQLKGASLQRARREGRPVRYLQSSATDKEAIARQIARQDGITEGLIVVLECVEPCRSFDIFRNRAAKRLELVPRLRKCKFLYHYLIHPVFGFMSARIQTWLPFSVQVCLNGREWLACQMQAAGIRFRRRDNCFIRVDGVRRAQRLLNEQLHLAWPIHLRRIARMLNPAHGRMFAGTWVDYYWSVYQSEWATDVMFEDAASLAELYPSLVIGGITQMSSADVMRFLGGKVHGAFRGEIVSDFKDRPEGVRLKHRVGDNSVKLYDKQGSILRVETTMNNPAGFKVYRRREGDPDGPQAWRPLRRGIADLHRRAQVSQACNERYLDALAALDTSVPLKKLLGRLCRPTLWNGRRFRALRPWAEPDMKLLQTVSRGEFTLNGFRNRDLQALLFDGLPSAPQQKRSRSAQVTRLLRLLRAHGLIKKVTSTHRYLLTANGREIIAAIIQSHNVTLEQLRKAAA